MNAFAKLLFLCSKFNDPESRLIIFVEWLRNDPMLDQRFRMETVMEVSI